MNLNHWVTNASSAFQIYVKQCTKVLLISSQDITTRLQECIPRYDHLITDTKFSKALAKTQLLGWSARDELDNKTPILLKNLLLIKQLYVEWGCKPDFTQVAEFAEHYDAMYEMYTEASKAITLIAALKVLFDLPRGKAQSDQASFIIRSPKSKKFPQTLLKALQAVVQ